MDQYEKLTGSIIGCAFKVHNRMQFGFLEKVYERCLVIELEKAGHSVRTQVPVSVEYDGQNVGEYVVDVLVDDTCVVELKSCVAIAGEHRAQLVSYLKATKLPVGLLLNFGPKNLDVARRTYDWLPTEGEPN